MRAKAKNIAFDQSSWTSLQIGVEKLAAVVGVTLSSRGRNAVLDEYGSLNDGFTIAEAFKLADPMEKGTLFGSIF